MLNIFKIKFLLKILSTIKHYVLTDIKEKKERLCVSANQHNTTPLVCGKSFKKQQK